MADADVSGRVSLAPATESRLPMMAPIISAGFPAPRNEIQQPGERANPCAITTATMILFAIEFA